jgi:hypothetical protein
MSEAGMKTERLLLVSGVLILGLSLVAPTFAQQPDSVCSQVEYFPETGHSVCDHFLNYLHSRGDVEIFGYPITEQFVENGRWVQYFQRVRMEYHPEQTPAYHVQLGLLGDFFAPADKKTRIDASNRPKSNDRNRRYFPETGHTIQHSFFEFFNENGGLDIFGYPVTEFYVENDRNLQYFQRALMEWDPNIGMTLHNIGEMWVDLDPMLGRLRDDFSQFAPSPEKDSSIPAIGAVSLRASVSVRNAFTGPDVDQTVWVFVTDQKGGSLAGATVTLLAPFLPGVSAIPMPPTDDKGHTEVNLKWSGLAAGQNVVLEAQVFYQGLTTQARAFFMAWW